MFVRQGHYAVESSNTVIDPMPNLTIGRIRDLLGHKLSDLIFPGRVDRRDEPAHQVYT